MPALSLPSKDIEKQIKDKQLAPVYLLWGEEDFFIDRLTALFETQLLDEMQKEFDFSLYFAPDLKSQEPGLKGVMANCKQFPVMSPFQVVIIKEAQSLDNWGPVEDYLQNPVATTVLVLIHKHKKIDKRKSVFKRIEKVGYSLESSPLSEAKYRNWTARYISERGYLIQNQALALLNESMGNNLNLMANELEKLFINLPPGSEINEETIEKYIGINKDYNVFKLEEALAVRDVVRTRKICNYIRQKPKDFPPQFVLPQLYRYFVKILQIHYAKDKRLAHNEVLKITGIAPYYFDQYERASQYYNYRNTAAIIRLIRQYDAKAKGVDSNGMEIADLMDELTFRILHI